MIDHSATIDDHTHPDAGFSAHHSAGHDRCTNCNLRARRNECLGVNDCGNLYASRYQLLDQGFSQIVISNCHDGLITDVSMVDRTGDLTKHGVADHRFISRQGIIQETRNLEHTRQFGGLNNLPSVATRSNDQQSFFPSVCPLHVSPLTLQVPIIE